MLMAVLAVCMTPSGRARLHKVVSASCVLGTTLSVIFLAAVLYSLARHSFLLRDLLINLLDLLYLNLVMRGVLLLILSLACWKINRNIALEPFNPSLSRSVMVWSALTLLCCGSAILWLVTEPGLRTRLQEAVSQRYKLAVKHYQENTEWLHTLDRVHNYVGCCGIDNYSDWYSTTWISLSQLPGDPVLYSKEAQPSGRVLVPLVPSSCCRVPSPDCGHLAWLQANHSWASLKPADPSLLYTSGCAPAVTSLFVIDLMLCKLLVLAVAVLQVVMLVGTRYVWSSTYNGVLMGRPGGAAPGWLVTGFGAGVLQHYNENCGDGKENMENHEDKKHKWRCIEKLRGKEVKDDGNDRASNRGRSRSPCIEKLKQKLKGNTKSKQDGGSKTNLNVESEYDTGDDENLYNDFPKKYAQAKNKMTDKNLYYEENESLPLLPKHQHVRIFDMATEQKSPFVEEQSKAIRSPLQTRDNSGLFKPSEIVKPKTGLIRSSYDSESEKDFQKTRSLFEKVARRVSPRTFHAKNPTQQQPSKLVQFDDFSKIKQQNQETKIQLGDSHSPRSEADSIPVLLRNYRIPPNV